ncbi:MAG: InlB B-repeat-containing protein [Planctomycetota bacterium]|jgi:hypothetical protein
MGYHYKRILPVPTYRLITLVNDANMGTIDPNLDPNDPNGLFFQYTVVELTATVSDPNIYRIQKWSGSDNAPAWYTDTDIVTMHANHTVTVTFEERLPVSLTLAMNGSGGDIRKLAVPAVGAEEDWPRDGTYTHIDGHQLRQGDVVEIVTQPSPGYVTVWSGT